MSLQTFFNNFALLADAPSGVAKLRELVLQLAVEGKLVPQDPRDEPADVLLDNIEAKQLHLVKEREMKEIAVQPVTAVHSLPFILPDGWQWTRLGSVSQKLGAGSTPLGGKNVYQDSGVKFLRSQNVWNYGLQLDRVAYISEKIHQDMSGTQVESGDILLNITGASIGRSSIVPEDLGEANVSQHVSIVRLIDKQLRFFIHLCIISPYVQDSIMQTQVGISREGLSMRSLKEFVLPIPPLEEQKRIVAKVDELMLLCDELEAQQRARRESRLRLNNVTLLPLNNAASLAPEEFEQASVRLAGNFTTLYDSAETVGKLRSTVLQLAVQGKLVPQDPQSEPANVLLEKITREKMRLSKEKKIRQPELILSDEETETPFQLPKGWVWARFGDITINRDGERIPIEKSVRQGRCGIYDYYGASGVIDKIDDYLFDKPLLLIGEDGANLINRATPIAFIAKGKYWVNNHAHVLDSLSRACLEYLEVFVNAIDLRPYITGTAQPKMNQAKMNSILVALAPEEEQKRIVAKVNQLMELCDELETKLRQAEADSEKLMNAGVRHLLDTIAGKKKGQRETALALSLA